MFLIIIDSFLITIPHVLLSVQTHQRSTIGLQFVYLVYVTISVLLVIWTRDNRHYQTSFPVSALTSGEHSVVLQMADLNKDVNQLRLFIDCKFIGEESTEVPIREALMGKIVVVTILFLYIY